MTRDEEFDEYHQKNPELYRLFVRFTLEAIRAGRKRLSVQMIYERIRWETTLTTVGDQYKINDKYRSRYSRKFMKDFPEYEGFFSTRRLRAA